jgi:hypothetical protein
MEEVKTMLGGTKTSVDNLLPKSEEIFNQVSKTGLPDVLFACQIYQFCHNFTDMGGQSG